jgi:predicted adenine nucleotide alpha hydrolase (AANH) superfamily ATPase
MKDWKVTIFFVWFFCYTCSMKLILHACCAPCSIQSVESLTAEGIAPDLFWYNPNIHPYTEYRSRRDSFRLFAESKKLPFAMEDEYGLRSFLKGVSSVEWRADENNQSRCTAQPRCAYCYHIRLERTASVAAEKNYDAFSTTLLISPYQDHDNIRRTGKDLATVYGVQFLYRDFRTLFREGRNQARAAGYYMQKYCGCIFSEEERYLGKAP